MRKDVKIGLGIGGVLLAVLIVYLLVPKNNDTSEYVRNDDSADTSDQAGAGTSATDATGGSAGAGATATNSGEGANEIAAQDTAGTTPGTPGQQDGNNTGADTADYDTTAATTPKVDWEKILVTGFVPPDARIPLVGRPGPSEPEDIFAPPAGGNAGAEPDWNAGRGNPQGSQGTFVAPTTPAQNPPTPPGPSGGATTGNTTGGASATREHVIQQGENLSMIAAVVYGDARRYRDILKANPGLDERRMRPGTRIKLPDASTFAAAQTAEARQEAKVNPTSEYRVEAGDSLHKIAVKLYGKAAKADTLYELNKDKIGDEPSRLKQGTVLKLPEPPAALQTAR